MGEDLRVVTYHKMLRGGPSVEMSQQGPDEKEPRMRVPGTRKSRCKGPEAGWGLTCLRWSKKATGVGKRAGWQADESRL